MFDVTEPVGSVGKEGHVRQDVWSEASVQSVAIKKSRQWCLYIEAQGKEGSASSNFHGRLLGGF